MTFCSIELPVTPWGDFLDVEKVTKDTFRRRGLRFPRLLKTSTLEPPKRNRARFPFDSLRGGQDFKPVVKLITAKKVSQNHGFPSKGSCRRRRLMRWKCTVFACNTSAWYTLNTSSGSLREPPSPQGEGFLQCPTAGHSVGILSVRTESMQRIAQGEGVSPKGTKPLRGCRDFLFE